MTIRTLNGGLRAGGGLGLALTVSLMALAGCSPASGPSAQSPDYYTEAPPPPPPLLGEAPSAHHDGLMGGLPPAPGEVYAQGGLPPAGQQPNGVVRFRRADGVLVTTMRPIPNPEDLSRAERQRIYGERQARLAAPAPRASGQLSPAPRASQPAVAQARPATPQVQAPAATAQPARPAAPQAQAPARPAPSAQAPVAKPPAPAPVASQPAAPAIAAAPEAEGGESTGRIRSFLERFKFWGREDAPETSEVLQGAGQAASDAGSAVESAATDAAEAAQESNISGSTLLMALAVLAAVLILAAISRNVAARRKEEQRRRRFRTFGYGETSEPEADRGSGLAAPVAAAAAGAAAATAVHNASDSAPAETAPARETEPA
ncbi:hypothetical protein [Phenylobacterium sp.]|uniref:hypothetical protein n=1 Tax=Phenylobacterium sp. TaxID=1871053 RepID=UPI002FDB2E1F